MFRTATRAVRVVNRRPAVLMAGFGLAVVDGLAIAVGAAVATSVDLPVGGGELAGFLAASLVWLLLAPAPIAALYVLGRETVVYGRRETDWREEAVRVVAVAREHYRPLFVATVSFSLLSSLGSLLTVVALAGSVLVFLTPVQFLGYHTPLTPLQTAPSAYLLGLGLLVAIARPLGSLPFRFYDTVSLFSTARPATAWAASIRFVLASPGALVRYAVGIWLPVAVFALVFLATVMALPAPATVPFGLFVYVVLGGLLAAYLRSYHLAFFEYTVSPTVCRLAPASDTPVRVATREELPLLTQKRRYIAVCLVFCVLVSGVTAVRVADVGGANAPSPDSLTASGSPPADLAVVTAEADTNRGENPTRATVDRATPATDQWAIEWLWDVLLY
ncbi:hypothetical protein [Haloarchaeobius sp. DFWS5]|uniref:hypothetical protein n=1 Tax=Haloarchaeobius sp. DFWS5 TaxID=3446114 RepID=UPI003EB976A6